MISVCFGEGAVGQEEGAVRSAVAVASVSVEIIDFGFVCLRTNSAGSARMLRMSSTKPRFLIRFAP